MSTIDRRAFLAASAGSVGLLGAMPLAAPHRSRQSPRRPVVISSRNGMPAVTRAMEMIRQGTDLLEAIVEGIGLVESDPDDMSVGYGGLPNEDGVVELDASVMHGPTHKSGAVAALRGIRNPARVALEVLRRTDHVLLVGAGALKFAKAVGFTEENLFTDQARQAWLRLNDYLTPHDARREAGHMLDPPAAALGQFPMPKAHAPRRVVDDFAPDALTGAYLYTAGNGRRVLILN